MWRASIRSSARRGRSSAPAAPFLFGADFTAADVMLAPVVARFLTPTAPALSQVCSGLLRRGSGLSAGGRLVRGGSGGAPQRGAWRNTSL